jgi:GDP-D-mannose 3', 5'-epimerase
MNSDFIGSVNIGSDEMVTINQLVNLVSSIENKKLKNINIDGPLGVAGHNSDNHLIYDKLGWKLNMKFMD